MLLQDRVCVITGASRGIGLETARLFARQGARVVLVGRQADPLEAAREAVAVPGGSEPVAVACDVGDPAGVKSLFQAVHARFKRLDVLVANAGVLDDAYVGMVTTAQMERVFATNTFGVLHCAQYASRMMARGGGGSIVNMASIVGVVGNAGQAVYAGSKAAVIGITKSLAKELAAQGVRVNAIAPGFIDTDMTRRLPPQKAAQLLAGIRMNRPGQPVDVANVALFLASDLSAYVTGQVIGVDGGMLI